MATIVRHAIVLLIADDGDAELEIATALADMGCLAHRATPGSPLEHVQPYDAAVLITRPNTPWSTAVLGQLRSLEFACATLVLLDAGGPEEVADTLRSGATDCMVQPVSASELLDGIASVIESTKRWRARFSRARLQGPSTRPVATSTLRPEMVRVFEPDEQATVCVEASSDGRDSARIEAVIDRVSGERSLTRREREVLHWLLLGHRYVDIALVLGVAPRTAKFHAANLLDKLGLDSRYDLPRLLAEELERGRDEGG